MMSLLFLVIACGIEAYSYKDLLDIGFLKAGSGYTDASYTIQFVGTYEYNVSEGNAMKLTNGIKQQRYPILFDVNVFIFQDNNKARAYIEIDAQRNQSLANHYICNINNLLIGINKGTNFSNYQKVCNYIKIQLN